MVLTSLIHTPRLTAYPSKEGMRCTRPKVYHSVDDDGSRDVSPLDFLNPLERGATTVAGYAAGGAKKKKKNTYYQLLLLISPRFLDFRRRRGGRNLPRFAKSGNHKVIYFEK